MLCLLKVTSVLGIFHHLLIFQLTLFIFMKTAVYLVCSNLISIMCYFILFMLYCLSTKFIKPLSICILLTVWNFFKVSQSFISYRHVLLVLFLVAMNLLLSDYMFMFSILLTNDAVYLWVNNLNAGYLVHGKRAETGLIPGDEKNSLDFLIIFSALIVKCIR